MENSESKTTFCNKPWTGFEIEHDGTVRQCCMTKVNTCGNINEQSISEIWNGEIYQDIRRKMANGSWADICRPECPWLHSQLDDNVSAPTTEAFSENYRINQIEIDHRAIVLESKPRFWKVTDSTRCNIDCIMCYQDRNDHRILPDKFYDELKNYFPGVQEIQLLGGETFTIKRFRELLSNFPKSSYPDTSFSLVTNGTVYDDKLLNLIRNVRVSWLSISIDAATDRTYSKIRRGGIFANTRIGIQKWADLGKEMGFAVLLAFTVMRDNLHEITDFIEFARSYNVDCIFGIVQGDKGQQNQFDTTDLKLSLLEAKEHASHFKEEMPFANLTLKSLFALVD